MSGTGKAYGEALVDETGTQDGPASSERRLVQRCVFCSRELDASFLYCPSCGGRIRVSAKPAQKWYYSRYAVVVGLLTIGPFALPLVWFNPRYRILTKIVLTVVVVGLTVLVLYLLALLYLRLIEQIRQLMTPY